MSAIILVVNQQQLHEGIRLVEDRIQRPSIPFFFTTERQENGNDSPRPRRSPCIQTRPASQCKPAFEENDKSDQRRDPAYKQQDILKRNASHIIFLCPESGRCQQGRGKESPKSEVQGPRSGTKTTGFSVDFFNTKTRRKRRFESERSSLFVSFVSSYLDSSVK